jgi:hypothetical protein
MHICLVSVEVATVVEMTSKKIFRNQADVARTPHFWEKKNVPASNTADEFTEKVQTWKLFFAKNVNFKVITDD